MKKTEILLFRYRTILSYTGLIFCLESAVALSPLLFLPFFPGEVLIAPGFLIPAGMLAVLGLGLRKAFRAPTYVTLTVREGGVIVLLSWIAACLFSSLPFIIVLKLTFTPPG